MTKATNSGQENSSTDVRASMLDKFVDWIVLRQQHVNRRATVSLWTSYNWPKATDEDIDYLYAEHRKHLEWVPA